MNILVLGGTGAMGKDLINILDTGEHTITVTSRSEREDRGTVHYVKGNAHDLAFLKTLVAGSEHFDAIVDFMSYSTKEFAQRYEFFLDATDQYVFISSARVYAQSDVPITENTPRLLDVSKDEEFLSTDEYALAKARSENLLNNSGKNSYTIVRPSITFSESRLQLGVLEKEGWLYRVLHGRSLVFSEDIASKHTAMTRGYDVARGIAAIIGKKSALGETFHITVEKSYTWRELMDRYVEVLKRHGINVHVVMADKCQRLAIGGGEGLYQIIYCRYFNRTFDNTKIRKYIDPDSFTDPMDGIETCLGSFLENPVFRNIDWRLEALSDRVAHEHTPLSEIPSVSRKVMYLCYRYHLGFLVAFLLKVKRFLMR